MAEAHSAVAFSFQVTGDGVSVSVDHDLLRNIWYSVVYSYKRRIGRFKNDFKAGIYPASPSTLLFTTCLILGLTLIRVDPSWGFINWTHTNIFKFIFGLGIWGTLVSAAVYSALIWFAVVQLLRLFIKFLFQYKGWMYERRGQKISPITKAWLGLVNVLGKFGPMLNSFQGSLARLPVPALDETVNKYLKSVRPILNDEKYEEMVKLADEFRFVGKRFQRYLLLKSWFSSNYVSDWWEEYVYLRYRDPIMINSNYYGLDTLFFHPTKNQAARAANTVYAALMFRRQLDRQELKPIMIGGVPLCSAQYERLFNTCRIPGEETDRLRHWDSSLHIAVYHKGCWYKFPVHTTKRLLTPSELQHNFQMILDDKDAKPSAGEKKIAALTAGKRIPWAKARKQFFSNGINGTSLTAIETAAFCLILDEEEHDYDPKDSSKLDTWALSLLHGKGYDRWFDKSFNLVVTKNGRVGLNAEHSWADAPIVGHLMEYMNWFQASQQRYTENGNAVGEGETPSSKPEHLKWNIPEECQTVIDESLATATALLNDVDMALLVFQEYGKGFIKKAKVSPDAYLQMALQITYYRMQGEFGLTYESSMTRLFREGRTETVRTVTKESCAFVRAFLDAKSTDEERLALLQDAAEKHVDQYKECMVGRGIDRHLFALYVVSRYLNIDSPFLKKVVGDPWLLSTSQTPHQQTDLIDLNKNHQYITAGGGFGPVSDAGYGVSYIIGGEDIISFHISSKKSCAKTSSPRFRETLHETLLRMKAMVENATPRTKKVANGSA